MEKYKDRSTTYINVIIIFAVIIFFGDILVSAITSNIILFLGILVSDVIFVIVCMFFVAILETLEEIRDLQQKSLMNNNIKKKIVSNNNTTTQVVNEKEENEKLQKIINKYSN